MEELTEAQQETLDYLIDYQQQEGKMPTYREMMRHLGLKSPAPVQARLKYLREKGYIQVDPGKARSIRLTQGQWRLIPTPLVEQVDELLQAAS